MWRRSAPLLSRACAQAVATTAGEATARSLPLAGGTTSFPSVLGVVAPASRLFSSWQSSLQPGPQPSSSHGGGNPGAGWGPSPFPRARSYSGASGALPSDSDESDFPAGGGSPLESPPLAGGLDPEAITAAAGAAELDALLQATEEAWYPTIGLQKLIETIHERGELPWCVPSPSHQVTSPDSPTLHPHRHPHPPLRAPLPHDGTKPATDGLDPYHRLV